MATNSSQNAVTGGQKSQNDLKGHVIFIYVLAGLQSVVPLLLGSPITAVLGPIIGILGYLIGRRYIWAAVMLAIIGTLNALVLALGKALGGTFLTMFMVASCIKCIGIIKRSRGEVPAAPAQPVSEPRVVPETKQVEDSVQSSESPASEGGFSMNTFARRLLLVFAAIVAMAIVIALGASSRQGGFLGAAIILVFWGMVKKKPQEAGPPDVQ
jgi:hypothetical protein